MKIEIEISDEEWRLMKRNRYGHGDVITQGYMLDILHDIVDQIHEEMHQERVYKAGEKTGYPAPNSGVTGHTE